jgi:hypothetical protein
VGSQWRAHHTHSSYRSLRTDAMASDGIDAATLSPDVEQQPQSWRQHRHRHPQQAQQPRTQHPPDQHQPDVQQWQVDPFDNIMAKLFHAGGPAAPLPLPAVATAPCSRLPVNIRLLVGQLPVATIGALGSVQRARFYQDLFCLLDAEGDEQPLPWLLYVRACSNSTQVTRAAYIDVVAKPDPAASTAALAAAAAGRIQLGPHSIPVVQMNDAQPLDTVELVVQQPPVVLGFQGFTAALLEAAGYTDVAVVAEWRGGSRAPGGAPERSRQFNSLVAWVKAPFTDPELRDLPGSFQDPTTGGTCRVQVRTRLPNGLKQFHARQALVAAAAPASPPPAPVPASPPDEPMEEATADQQTLDTGADMQVDGSGTAVESQPASQQPQAQQPPSHARRSKRVQKHQHSGQQPVNPPQPQAQRPGASPQHQLQRATRSSKRVQHQQPSDAEVQQWMAASEVWCSLAEQAQHLLESLDRPWTQREQQTLAAAYMVAFERSSAQTSATEREWLLDHYGLTPDQEEYADGVTNGGQRRYPVRANRGLPADPWYAAGPPQAPPCPSPLTLNPIPTRPTGAQGRQGRTR